MQTSIEDRVLDFYNELFYKIFTEPSSQKIDTKKRFNEVKRQIESTSDAASSSLTRFFLSQQLSIEDVDTILAGFEQLKDLLKLEDLANSYVTPEEIVENLLPKLPCPQTIQTTQESVYRLALYTIVQVLVQVGPIVGEWQKLNFASTFELPRRISNKLNEIDFQLQAFAKSGREGADENYEIQYRDYLAQRFYKVEAGTVRMATSQYVDLGELFVMPSVKTRTISRTDRNLGDSVSLMDLLAARQSYRQERFSEENQPIDTALQQVKNYSRNVIVGLPGVGKSTFLEWLQLKIAFPNLEEEQSIFILGDRQAIPLLLRVRQLDPLNLPQGATLIEKATASKERANLMPDGWIDRQMEAGRILFMLDGLDETEPELRNNHLIPWLGNLIEQYPNCHYLISSRPVGYSYGQLRSLEFVECDLLDFNESQIQQYTSNWCTAVRLAQNESETEARREGNIEGKEIFDGFQENPYIRNLARNPLMLSAICLVNYFEGGQLPKDRALLYQLCVEGLLHYWDHRRGIRSEFELKEKLRVVREVAIAMQAESLAEYESDRILGIFTSILKNQERGKKLLEHIRYRTGILIERRPSIFGFAHLTFQEYLAARAVFEGNKLKIDAEQLVREHDDGKWKEVIPLYCGLATTPAARNFIESLIYREDTKSLSTIMTEAYLTSGSELAEDQELRNRLIERIAIAPGRIMNLDRFPKEEVAPIANVSVGKIKSQFGLSEAFFWFSNSDRLEKLNETMLMEKLQNWNQLNGTQLSEIVFLLNAYSSEELLATIATMTDMYSAPGPEFSSYNSQAEVAFEGLSLRFRGDRIGGVDFETALLAIMRLILEKTIIKEFFFDFILLTMIQSQWHPQERTNRIELASLVRKWVEQLNRPLTARTKTTIENIKNWANYLEGT